MMARHKLTPRVIRHARWAALSAAVAALLCLNPGGAHAYPDRNILMIVPFAPGGPTDIIARIISAAFQKSLGQSVIVDNRGGAAGISAWLRRHARRRTATRSCSPRPAIAVNPALFNKLGYDPFKDFAADLRAGQRPQCHRGARRFRHQFARDLVARAKAAPNTFNYSSPGVGTKSHLSGEELKLRAGIQMTHVPYRGAGPAALAVLEGTTASRLGRAGGGGISGQERPAPGLGGDRSQAFGSRCRTCPP